MDRNSIIGFMLLALLFFGYFYYTKQGQLTYEKEQQHIQDSIDKLKPKIDTTQLKKTNLDSIAKIQQQTQLQGILQDTTGK